MDFSCFGGLFEDAAQQDNEMMASDQSDDEWYDEPSLKPNFYEVLMTPTSASKVPPPAQP